MPITYLSNTTTKTNAPNQKTNLPSSFDAPQPECLSVVATGIIQAETSCPNLLHIRRHAATARQEPTKIPARSTG